MRSTGVRWPIVAIIGVVASTLVVASATAADDGPPRDVDAWHEALERAIGRELVDQPTDGWTIGLYPTVGVAGGPPDWIAYQVHGSVSLTHGGHFSVFAGCGFERGPSSETTMVTVGWGGVQRLHAGRDQRGFYGKFLRYRRIEDESHGLHHGLSVGHESCAGVFGLSIEVGAARSSTNHWTFTGQVAFKLALPVVIPLSRSEGMPSPP